MPPSSSQGLTDAAVRSSESWSALAAKPVHTIHADAAVVATKETDPNKSIKSGFNLEETNIQFLMLTKALWFFLYLVSKYSNLTHITPPTHTKVIRKCTHRWKMGEWVDMCSLGALIYPTLCSVSLQCLWGAAGWSWSQINVQASYVNLPRPHTEPPKHPSTPSLLTMFPRSRSVNGQRGDSSHSPALLPLLIHRLLQKTKTTTNPPVSHWRGGQGGGKAFVQGSFSDVENPKTSTSFCTCHFFNKLQKTKK